MRLRRKLSEKQILMVYKFYKTTQRFFVILALTGILFSLFPNQKFYAATEVDTKPETVEKDYYQSSDVDISLVPIVEEDVSKRTANEKHFRKLDGTYEVALYDNEVHYYENGTWHDIDNRFIDDGNKLENKQNAFKTFFPKNLSDNKSIQIKTKDYSIDWRVIDIDKTSAEYVTNNQKQNVKNELNSIDQSVFYSNIRPNVDLEYILQGSDVKEYIILNDFIDNFSISFEYSLKNLKLVKLSDGIFFVDLNGEKVFEFEDLFMFDSNNEVSSDVEIEIIETKKDTYLVTVLPNLDWLSGATYPVKIDPTLNSNTTEMYYYDTYVSEIHPYTSYGNTNYMYLSNTAETNRYKGLISFRIPVAVRTQVITYANISFVPYQVTTNAQLNIYKNTTSFSSNVTWDSWHANQTYDLSVVDYHVINPNSPFVFDITESVKEWQAQGIYTVPGFTISHDDDFGSLNVVYQMDISDYTKKPVIKIGYEDPSGLKEYWTYTSQDLGMAGTGFISDYTGNLTFVRDEYKLDNEIMPLTLSFLHNSFNRTSDIGYGKGWRTNYSLEIKYDSISSNYYMIKADGSKLFFMNLDCISDDNQIITCDYLSEDGSRMRLNVVINNLTIESMIVTTKNDIEYEFNSSGRLISIRNLKTNHKLWIYYMDSTSLKISYIKDSADNRVVFSYVSNRMSQTLLKLKQDNSTYYDVERRDYVYDSGGNLDYIDYDFRYGNEQNTNWTTELNNRIQYEFDTSNRLINVYNEKDLFKVDYSYDIRNRVNYVETTNNDHLIDQTTITYQNSRTIYTDHNDKNMYYSFDFYGHTVNIMDDYGNTAYYRYSGLFSFDDIQGQNTYGYYLTNVTPNYYNNHRLIESSDVVKQIHNPIQNHGFEQGSYGWTLNQGNGTIVFTDEDSLLGESSLKITRISTNIYASQQLYLTQGEYKIEGWIKNSGSAPGAYIDIENAIAKGTISKVYQKNDWTKYELTFHIIYPVTITVKLINESNSSSAYFDNIQISKGFVDSRYNAVNNNSFETGLSGWDSIGVSTTVLNETGLLKDILGYKAITIVGDGQVNSQAKQYINHIGGFKSKSIIVGGWAKADAVPNKGYLFNGGLQYDNRFFGLKVIVEMDNETKDGREFKTYFFPFNSNIEDWQYQSHSININETVYSTEIYIIYNGEGTAYFDNIHVYHDETSTKYLYEESTGNLLSVSKPDGTIKNYNYDANGNLISITENGKTVLIERNASTQISQIQAENNVRTTFTYDPITRQLKEVTVGNNTSSQDKWFKSSTTYTSDNLYINTVKDEFGNTTTWNVDKRIGTVSEIIDAIGNIQSFEYDAYGNLIRVVIDSSTSSEFLEGEYHYDTMGRLWKIDRDGYTYEFTYNPLNQVSGVKIADVDVMSYEYLQDSTGIYHPDLLTKQTYGNSDYVEFTYTEEKQIKTVSFNGFIRYEYVYDSFGNLSILKDIHNNNIYFYSYDLSGRLENITDKNGNLINFDYDLSGNKLTFNYEISGISREVSYHYNSTTGQYDYTQYYVGTTEINKDFNYDTDSLKRLNNIELSIGNIDFKKIFGYDDNKVDSSMGNATNRIYQITYQKNNVTQYVHKYSYDANHNITKIEIKSQTGFLLEQYDYDYDGFNQLIREDINIVDQLEKTLIYSYNSQNNITSIKTYDYFNVSGTPLSEKKMYYQNTWKDQLTRVEYYTVGTLSYYETMTYDNSGNIINLSDSRTSYLNKTYQWDGRQLTNYGSYCNSLTFKYNDQGIRTQKIQSTCGGNITTNYVMNGDQVLVETRSNGITIYYTYDVDGSLLSMNYNGTEYFYITNLQGDIIELVDINGISVVTYKYDAWGNIVYQSPGTLADINLYRYRGYRFDIETGFYYLQSRYYNPQIGRFISADGQVNDGILGENMYAYAENNPIMNVDPLGENPLAFLLPFLPAIAYKAAVAALYILTAVVIYNVLDIVFEAVERDAENSPKIYTVYILKNEAGEVVYVGRVLTKNYEARMTYHKGKGRVEYLYLDNLTYWQCRGLEQAGIWGHATLGVVNGNKINGISAINPMGIFYYSAAAAYKFYSNQIENEFLNLKDGS